MALKMCPGYVGTGDSPEPADHSYSQPPHPVEYDGQKGGANVNFGPGKSQCRTCYGVYSRDWRARRKVGMPTAVRRTQTPRGAPRPPIVLPDFRAPALEALEAESRDGADDDEEFVSAEDLAASRSHAYVPQPDMIEGWAAVTNGAADGSFPENLMFLGDKGTGKSEGAKYLAGLVGLDFTKVDAASMTEPEAWFGTREVVESESGASVTSYRPSSFVLALERPGVLFIDEINRSKEGDRNVLLPVMSDDHQVTNPLTGDVVKRHRKCFIIMAGNRGINYTGTYTIEPAFLDRSLIVHFDYASQAAEMQIATEATGCDEDVAQLFVRFAAESRLKAKVDPDFDPISTRQVIRACKMVSKGASPDLAARWVVLNGATDEGGPSSVRFALESIWTGIRKSPGGAITVKCGMPHAYETRDGKPVTCDVDVPTDKKAMADLSGANPHADAPQHHAAPGVVDYAGDQIAWFDA